MTAPTRALPSACTRSTGAPRSGALTTSAGRVPDGKVDRELLMDDPTAPFGVRLDPDAVVDAFESTWRNESVVLVEGSDLVRADIQGQFASERAREKLRDRALRDTDRLIGRLLDDVDPESGRGDRGQPGPADARRHLDPRGGARAGFGTGLLESPTSQRAGFVNVVDIAPTVLDLLGIDTPDAMEGRPMESVSSDAAIGERIDQFADTNSDSVFADEQTGIARGVLFAVGLVLAIATVALVDRVRRARGLLSFVALALIGFLVATYLAQPFHFADNGGATAYWLFVVAVALALAGVDILVGRRLGNPLDALLVALGTLAALHLVDLMVGAPLELNTVFGYSATTDWRIGGVSGFAFAQLAAASHPLRRSGGPAGTRSGGDPGRAGTCSR